MIDVHPTHCPLCRAHIVIEKDSIYENRYPTFRCENVDPSLNRIVNSHYVKYFSSDWSSSHYVESIRLNGYNVYNYFVFRRENKPEQKDHAVVYKVIGQQFGRDKKQRIRCDIIKPDKPDIMIVQLEKLFALKE